MSAYGVGVASQFREQETGSRFYRAAIDGQGRLRSEGSGTVLGTYEWMSEKMIGNFVFAVKMRFRNFCPLILRM